MSLQQFLSGRGQIKRRYLKTLFVLVGSGFLIGGLFGNCSNVTFAPSPMESVALKSEVFKFDPHSSVDGVSEKEGIPTKNLRVSSAAEAESQYVSNCAAPVKVGDLVLDRKVWERMEALKAASEDPTHKTVPVEYALSFGQAEDELAIWAHKRAILSESNPGQFRLSEYGDVLRQREGILRGHESEINLKEVINLPLLQQNFGSAVRGLSAPYTASNGKVFAGMVGMPQLLSNLQNAAGLGVVLASQYTPVVLDLGAPKVRTSSLDWGTYFNMSGEKDDSKEGLDAYLNPHKTAWLGGELLDRNPAATAKDGFNFQSDFRRVSDDGFLALPDTDGKIRSSRNLFGDRTEINGKTYANGFVALQVFAKKDYTSADIKDHYIGPWDSSYSEIKVWVDGNRNGVAAENEISSLKDNGVAAINVCYIEHMQAQDAFGNGTSMRSAFLKVDPSAELSETEIVNRLQNGKSSDGKDAEFRLAVDLLFQVQKSATLE